MYGILSENGDEKTNRFFKYLTTLVDNEDWMFDLSNS